MYFLFLFTYNVKISSVTCDFCCEAFLINHKVFPKFQLNYSSPRDIFACKFLSGVIYYYIWYVDPLCLFYRHKEFFSLVIVLLPHEIFWRRFLYRFAFMRRIILRAFWKLLSAKPYCSQAVLPRLRGRMRVTPCLTLGNCYMAIWRHLYEF